MLVTAYVYQGLSLCLALGQMFWIRPLSFNLYTDLLQREKQVVKQLARGPPLTASKAEWATQPRGACSHLQFFSRVVYIRTFSSSL